MFAMFLSKRFPCLMAVCVSPAAVIMKVAKEHASTASSVRIAEGYLALDAGSSIAFRS